MMYLLIGVTLLQISCRGTLHTVWGRAEWAESGQWSAMLRWYGNVFSSHGKVMKDVAAWMDGGKLFCAYGVV